MIEKASRKFWIFGSLFFVCLISYYIVEARTRRQSSTLNFVIPAKTWGFFSLKRDVNLKPGTYTIRVPMDGKGPAVPENPYQFKSITFDDGTPIYSPDNDPREVVPGPPADQVRFEWLQTSDADGLLFFVGTEAQMQAGWETRITMGLRQL